MYAYLDVSPSNNQASMGDDDHNLRNQLPPGFRFYPSDQELVVHFLQRKASLLPCHPDIIPDLHLHPYDPWDLNGKAMMEGNKWYFYSRRIENRITESGYWKKLGGEESIFVANKIVGVKKYYMFYIGDQSEFDEGKNVKTNWIMQELRLSDSARSSKTRLNSKDHSRWVICQVYEQNNDEEEEAELSCLDEVFLSMDDDFEEISFPN